MKSKQVIIIICIALVLVAAGVVTAVVLSQRKAPDTDASSGQVSESSAQQTTKKSGKIKSKISILKADGCIAACDGDRNRL